MKFLRWRNSAVISLSSGRDLLEVKVGLDESEAAVLETVDVKALLVAKEKPSLLLGDLAVFVGVESMPCLRR